MESPPTGRLLRAMAMALLVLWAGLLAPAAPASARESFSPGSVCYVSLKIGETYEDYRANAARWQCSGENYNWKAPGFLVRHDLRGKDGGAADPQFAEFERYSFETLTVVAEAADGSSSSRTYGFRDARLGASSLRHIVEVPEVESAPVAIVFVLEGGEWPESLAAARLTANPSVDATAGVPHLLAALLCGLLLAPMLFDFGYFRALREPFPLFHAVFCAMAFVQTAAVSGLLPLFTNISFEAELAITYLSLDFMVAATFLFAGNFIENGCLTRRQRRALLGLAAVVLVNGGLTTFLPQAFGDWIDHVYFGCLVLVLGGYFHLLSTARTRGSRMAPYLTFGFAPLASIVIIQATGVFVSPLSFTFDETWPQNYALLFEVVATALAVAERFMSVRRERDKALDDARSMEALSERDELTGLLNRRALDIRYASLIAQGFSAMALIDIDHFKSINDLHGHPVGDAVLRSTAAALAASKDDDIVAFRIGGEEFLLFLRGDDTAKRAEQRRRAVTVRTLAEIDVLERPVTASMGFLDFGAIALRSEMDFSALYSRADQLLYAAKCDGRNRTAQERLKEFDPAEGSERVAAA